MVTVLAFLAVGVVLGRWPGRPEGLGPALDWFVVRVAFPARILTLVPVLELGTRALVPVGAAWGVMLLLGLLAAAVARLAGWPRRVLATLVCVVPFGNTAFLGFPTVELLLGADHLGWALLYDQAGTFLALGTVGSVLLGVFGEGGRATVRSIARRVATFPPLVAFVLGFGLRLTGTPTVLDDVLAGLGATLVPLAIASVGMRLRVPRGLSRIGPLVAGIGLRVAVAPLAVLAVIVATGVSGPQWSTALLQAGMSSSVVASILAADNGLDGELAANLAGLGVLAAIALAPVWAAVGG